LQSFWLDDALLRKRDLRWRREDDFRFTAVHLYRSCDRDFFACVKGKITDCLSIIGKLDCREAAVAREKGREIKHTGDGIMAAFVSAAAAVRCAIEVQNKIRQSNAEHPGQPLQLRIGLAAGEPIEHHHDLFGATVQLAARLCARANPEQIMMSNAVAKLCIGKALPMIDAGAVVLKGFDQPVHVHCIDCMHP
jgi:hypothetical protein